MTAYQSIMKNPVYRTHAKQVVATRARATRVIVETLRCMKKQMKIFVKSFHRYGHIYMQMIICSLVYFYLHNIRYTDLHIYLMPHRNITSCIQM